MQIEELKKRSNIKVLLRGRSGHGKTKQGVEITLQVLDGGGSVLFIDTESEGATTLVNEIEAQDYDEDVVENLDYTQAENYEQLKTLMGKQEEYDMVVIDTLDHKHSYVLKEVTDAKRQSDAEWNEYSVIYSEEKEFMEMIGKPDANIIATVDPDSGKLDKPKGAQTNIHGYFSVVIDLSRNGDNWGHKITNWVGRSDLIGGEINNIPVSEALSEEILERVEAAKDF